MTHLKREKPDDCGKDLVAQGSRRIDHPQPDDAYSLGLILEGLIGKLDAAHSGQMCGGVCHDGVEGRGIRQIQGKPDITHRVESFRWQLLEHHGGVGAEPWSKALEVSLPLSTLSPILPRRVIHTVVEKLVMLCGQLYREFVERIQLAARECAVHPSEDLCRDSTGEGR